MITRHDVLLFAAAVVGTLIIILVISIVVRRVCWCGGEG